MTHTMSKWDVKEIKKKKGIKDGIWDWKGETRKKQRKNGEYIKKTHLFSLREDAVPMPLFLQVDILY